MRTAPWLLAGVCSAWPVQAADDDLLEASDSYFQCAGFYQGAMDADLLPKGRAESQIEADVAKAVRAAVGIGITAREGPRRMTLAEIEAMERRVAQKARGLEREFRADPAYAKGWIADGFAFCDEKMGLVGPTQKAP